MPETSAKFRAPRAPFIILLIVASSACSAKQIGLNRMADALTTTASLYGRDNDIELVRAAAPSTLKLVEMVLEEQPNHVGLLTTACTGFTQYSYGFLHVDAEVAEASDPARAEELRTRAGLMYERARGYCTRALEVRHRGFRDALARDPAQILGRMGAADVPNLYWLAVAWTAEMSLAKNQLLRLQELVTVRALFARALAIDEAWDRGAIHEAMIAVEGMPALLGGSVERATKHFNRAIELSKGGSAFAYVTMATSVDLPARDRAAFDRRLKAALAIDVNAEPASRLVTLVAQKRARFLLSRAAALFPAQKRD